MKTSGVSLLSLTNWPAKAPQNLTFVDSGNSTNSNNSLLPAKQNNNDKWKISLASALLAAFEVVTGLVQSNPISNIFATTSAAECAGALALNLPPKLAQKAMSLAQLTIGGALALEFLPRGEAKANSPLVKASKFSRKHFHNFVKNKLKINPEHAITGMKIALPIWGVLMALAKNVLAKKSCDENEKCSLNKSRDVDGICFFESLVCFIPEGMPFYEAIQFLYQAAASSGLIVSGLRGLTNKAA